MLLQDYRNYIFEVLYSLQDESYINLFLNLLLAAHKLVHYVPRALTPQIFHQFHHFDQNKVEEIEPLELDFFLFVSEDFRSETQRVGSFCVDIKDKEENE
jgi:hypothetical protein